MRNTRGEVVKGQHQRRREYRKKTQNAESSGAHRPLPLAFVCDCCLLVHKSSAPVARINAPPPLQKRLPAPARGLERTQPSCRVWTRQQSTSQHRRRAAQLMGRLCRHWFSLLQGRKTWSATKTHKKLPKRRIPERTVLALRKPPPPSPLAGGFFFK
jgi:hypothetical protein